MLPQITRSPVSPTPLYCPPKNRAVVNSSAPKYRTPVAAHTAIRCRLIFPADTTAPIQEDRTSISSTQYPLAFQPMICASISFAVISAPSSVMATADITPAASPAGTADAVPVGFRFTVMFPSPFSIDYWKRRKKRTGTG